MSHPTNEEIIEMISQERDPPSPRLINGYIELQFHGYELVLCPDNHWYINDTSGG